LFFFWYKPVVLFVAAMPVWIRLEIFIDEKRIATDNFFFSGIHLLHRNLFIETAQVVQK